MTAPISSFGKVGDFGLSCLKESTVLTAKSGRGTVRILSNNKKIAFVDKANCPCQKQANILQMIVNPLITFAMTNRAPVQNL